MKWWGAIWQAVLAFFKFLIVGNKDKPEEDQDQEQQDQIVEDTQEVINEVPDKSDADLLDIAESTGLVRMRRDADPGSGAGGAGNLGTGDSDFSGRKPGSSFKARG